MRLAAARWSDFQHYKNRRPPWIRLHRTLLDNPAFQRLPVASKALAPMLWLVASEAIDGVIDMKPDDIAYKLRMSDIDFVAALKPLLDKEFFSADSEMLAACSQLAPESCPEAEAEAEADVQRQTQRQRIAPGSAVAARAPTKTAAPSSDAWASYATAYAKRYGEPPVRNAKVNGQLANLVARLGADEAPAVAAFYVGHQGMLYVRSMHAVDLLLRDAEKLRTEWATGRQVTNAQARQADNTQTNFNAFAPLLAAAEAQQTKEANADA